MLRSVLYSQNTTAALQAHRCCGDSGQVRSKKQLKTTIRLKLCIADPVWDRTMCLQHYCSRKCHRCLRSMVCMCRQCGCHSGHNIRVTIGFAAYTGCNGVHSGAQAGRPALEHALPGCQGPLPPAVLCTSANVCMSAMVAGMHSILITMLLHGRCLGSCA